MEGEVYENGETYDVSRCKETQNIGLPKMRLRTERSMQIGRFEFVNLIRMNQPLRTAIFASESKHCKPKHCSTALGHMKPLDRNDHNREDAKTDVYVARRQHTQYNIVLLYSNFFIPIYSFMFFYDFTLFFVNIVFNSLLCSFGFFYDLQFEVWHSQFVVSGTLRM